MMKHTKHLLVLWAALLLGAGNAWGAEETVLWADGTYVSPSITWTSANFTILQEKGSSSTAVNSSYVSAPRWYASHLITITAGSSVSTISTIKITATSESYATALANSTYTVTGGSGTIKATASSKTVTITCTGIVTAFTIKMGAQSRLNGTNSPKGAVITYETGTPPTTLYLGLFLAAFVAVCACVRRVECLYATFHHIIMSKIDFRSVHFAKALFFLFSVHFFCLTKRNEPKKSQDCGGCVAKNLSFRCRLNRTRCARTAI